MGQIQFTVALVLFGLFAFALVGFAVGFANDNNTEISLTNDPEISTLYTETQGNLSGFDESAEESYASIIDSTVTEGSQTTVSGGQFALTPLNTINVARNVLKVGYVKIFGTGAGFGVFITTFLGLLVFIIGLYVWKTWRGLPD